MHVGDQAQGGGFRNRIHQRRRRIEQQQHVALINGLKAGDAAAVKSQAIFEHFLIQALRRNGEMVPCAQQIGEFNIHHFGMLFLCQRQSGFYIGHNTVLLKVLLILLKITNPERQRAG
jgi:hypothetical protein